MRRQHRGDLRAPLSRQRRARARVSRHPAPAQRSGETRATAEVAGGDGAYEAGAPSGKSRHQKPISENSDV